ncbi:Winged helix-turn-helix DNA-binding protein [uncultured archaeon]|nr:Winged helix-turn-helix DNA-binding protein [uncultured archaeon]
MKLKNHYVYKVLFVNKAMDIKNRKWLLSISVAAIVMFLVVFLSNVSEVQEYERASGLRPNISDSFGMNGTSRNAGHHGQVPLSYRLLLSPALLTVAAVFATYYFISRRLEEKLEKNMSIISKLIDKNNSTHKENIEKADNSTVLKFFNASERKILEKLIENNGTTLQSEISRMEGMDKLRTHRTLKALERKGIIKIEDHGKTNRIILAGDARDILIGK